MHRTLSLFSRNLIIGESTMVLVDTEMYKVQWGMTNSGAQLSQIDPGESPPTVALKWHLGEWSESRQSKPVTSARNDTAGHTLQEIKSSFVGHISSEEEFWGHEGGQRTSQGARDFAGWGVSTVYKLEARCSIRIPSGSESTRYYLVWQ